MGKSDPIDARAIARIVAREPDLPGAHCAEGPTEDLGLLTSYRKGLTRVVNQVHADLMIVRPGYQQALPQLTGRPMSGPPGAAARELQRPGRHHPVPVGPAEGDRRPAQGAHGTDRRAGHRHRQPPARDSRLRGADGWTDPRPDRRRPPVPGPQRLCRRQRHRADPGQQRNHHPEPAEPAGNRHLNEALHTIAIVQLRGFGSGRAYVAKQRAAGHSNREAMRSLKRRLSDVVYRTLVADLERGPTGLTAI